MDIRSCHLLPLVLALFALSAGARALPAAPPLSPGERFFEDRVRPLLATRCFRCHGPVKHKGGLRLDSRPALLAGGDRGPALTPRQPQHSLLVSAVGYQDADLKMPPNRPLSREEVADLRRWVEMGAPWPGGTTATPARAGGLRITDQDRRHWAFQPLRRPRTPAVRDRAWSANPIDAFILAKLEARALRPNPPASRRELIRRVTFDLTGLPPTPRQVEDFVHDPSPHAYERLVDRLLASPHYGEKWGRHWLDLVRFAETNSYERDNPKPNAWRYRDYVIRAFNEDRPYNRFVREQLAGDELPDADADAVIATGYYRLGIWDDEPTDPLQARYDGLDDIVATTGQVFLGLTMDCARCHDHKIDPIPQKDYYRLLAFFHNINSFHNGGPTDEADLRRFGRPSGKALCVTEAGNRAPDTYVLVRGNAHVHGARLEPGFPEVLGQAAPVMGSPQPGARTSGRRRVLADWIASPDNPLTARVLVNRLWQHHFGRGIVRSPNDFGLHGDRPTHPELLDWLAAELVHDGWRFKPLHRLILTSRAYRMSSRGNASGLAADPANDLFWRFDLRRLTAEEVRDAILAVTGTLNPEMYGPGMYPELPREVLAGQSMPGYGWGKSSAAEQARRSVYVHVKRSLLAPLLESFDVAETDRTTPVRFVTTQPTQALHLLNGDFLNRQAAAFAGRLRREAGADVGRQVRLALRLATGRPPSEGQVRRGLDLIRDLRAEGASERRALADFCLVVLNLNELVYVD
jgi:cytochrome c553